MHDYWIHLSNRLSAGFLVEITRLLFKKAYNRRPINKGARIKNTDISRAPRNICLTDLLRNRLHFKIFSREKMEYNPCLTKFLKRWMAVEKRSHTFFHIFLIVLIIENYKALKPRTWTSYRRLFMLWVIHFLWWIVDSALFVSDELF